MASRNMYRSTAAIRCSSQFFACFFYDLIDLVRGAQRPANQRIGKQPHRRFIPRLGGGSSIPGPTSRRPFSSAMAAPRCDCQNLLQRLIQLFGQD